MVFATVIEPIMLFIILCGHCEHPYLLFFYTTRSTSLPYNLLSAKSPRATLPTAPLPDSPWGEKKLKKNKVGKSTLRQITSPRLRDQWISAGAHAAQQRLDQ